MPDAMWDPDDLVAGVDGGRADAASVLGAVRLSPLRRRHLRAVVRIEEECYPRPWSATLFLSEIAQRTSRRYIVATIGPLVVGYCGLMMVGDDGHVTTVTVDPAWHRRGIATLMLLDVARIAPTHGIRNLTLEVRVSNAPAQVLYRRFGFAPVGVRKNYYAETGEDAIVMWARDIDSDAYRRRLDRIEEQLRSHK